MLQIVLGLMPERHKQCLVTVAPTDMPTWLGDISVTGVPAFDRRWDVQLANGKVEVSGAR